MGNEIDEKIKLEAMLESLLQSQKLGVLSTIDKNKPYNSLVAFINDDSLKNIIFATSRESRKYRNILQNPRVSFLIDNRENRQQDFEIAFALNAQGLAAELDGPEEKIYKKQYLNYFPYLEDFISVPSIAFMKIEVLEYNIVSRFQNTVTYKPG